MSAALDSAPSPPDLIPAPYLGALCAYTTAYLRSDMNIDEVLALLDRDWAARHSRKTVEPFSPEGSLNLRMWMSSLDSIARPAMNLLLPEPGNMAGLVGPPRVFGPALASGQALVVTTGLSAHHTLCVDPPRAEHSTWMHLTAHSTAQMRPVELLAAHASGVREALYRFLDEAHARIAELDIVPDEPVRARSLPRGWLLMEAPPSMHPTHVHTARLAGRLTVLAEEALGASMHSEPYRRVLTDLRRHARATLLGSLSYASM